MSDKLKILIVEDEYVTIKTLTKSLTEMEYTIVGDAMSAAEAITILGKNEVDLAILDINIKGEKDGIWLADYINHTFDIPFIFLTAYGNKEVVERAVKVKPYGYLIKPFQKADVFVAIEVAINNYSLRKMEENILEDPSKAKDSIFIKDDYTFVKLIIKDINYIESINNYLDIYSHQKEYRVRATLKEFMEKLPSNFVRCHRGFVVNTTKVTQVSKNFLKIGEKEIPYSNSYKKVLLAQLNMI